MIVNSDSNEQVRNVFFYFFYLLIIIIVITNVVCGIPVVIYREMLVQGHRR